MLSKVNFTIYLDLTYNWFLGTETPQEGPSEVKLVVFSRKKMNSILNHEICRIHLKKSDL